MASPVRQRGVQNSCGHCGAHVSHDFARVFGDNDGLVHRCPNCAIARSICAMSKSETIWNVTTEQALLIEDPLYEQLTIQVPLMAYS